MPSLMSIGKLSGVSAQVKAVVLRLLLIVSGGSLAYVISMTVVRQHWVESRKKTGLAYAEDEARNIHVWLDTQEDRLIAMSKSVSSLSQETTDLRGILADLCPSDPDTANQPRLMFMLPACRIIYSTLPSLPDSSVLSVLCAKARGWNLSPRNVDLTARQRLILGKNGLFVAVPCRSRSGKFLGSLVSWAPFADSPLARPLKFVSVIKGAGILLVDTTGAVLVPSSDAYSPPEHNAMLLSFLTGKQTGWTPQNGGIFTFARCDNTPWYVVFRQSTAGLDAEIKEIRDTILLISIVSMSLLSILSIGIVNMLTILVRALVRATHTVAHEKFEPIAMNIGGEIGELITAFNGVGDSLNRTYRKLSTLSSLSACLVSDLKGHDVGQRVVRAVLDSMKVSTCALLTPDESGQMYLESFSSVDDKDSLRDIDWNGFAWIREVAASTGPLIDNNLRTDRSITEECVGCKSLAAPLPFHGKWSGVLAAFNRRKDENFTELHAELLGTFANQATDAIQNASKFQLIEEDLANIRKLKDELIQSEKMAAIGQLVSGVAHELNNPLGVVIGYAELLEQSAAGDRLLSYASKIRDAAQWASEIVRNLLSFARKRQYKSEEVNLNQVVAAVLEILAHPLRLGGIQVVPELDQDLLAVTADCQEMQQIFLNLIINAMQALEGIERPRLVIRTSNTDNLITAIVSDNGPGIPPELHSRVFDPFFTTKPVGKGTGLGLSICYGIVADMAGTIRIEIERGQGASFIIELPAVSHPHEGQVGSSIAISASAKPQEVGGETMIYNSNQTLEFQRTIP